MEITTKLIALLNALSRDHIAVLPPAEKQRFADQLARIFRMVQAEDAETPKARVLARLKTGERSE